MANLDQLKTIKGFKDVSFDDHRCFLYEDHRWILPIIHFAQENGELPKPCTIVSFDAHHDTVTPTCLEEIETILKNGITLDQLIYLCKDNLTTLDDDWLKGGMELGLIDDAVIFGVQDSLHNEDDKVYNDQLGNPHRIEVLDLFSVELQNQGALSDLAKRSLYKYLWGILDWQLIPKNGFNFGTNLRKILLDFDLDCFTVSWRECNFAWPDKIFLKEFFTESTYYTTQGWNGKGFVDSLIKKAGLVTIALEPGCCGGKQESDDILKKTNKYLLDDRLGV